MGQKSKKKPSLVQNYFYLVLLVGLLGFITHSYTLFSDFTFDDSLLFKEKNIYSCANTNLFRIFHTNYFFGINYFRPIITSLFYFESCLYGQNPFYYKFLNLVLFFFTSITILSYLKYWFSELDDDRRKWISIVIACLWVFHPVQVELVNQVTNRFDLVLILLIFFLLINTAKSKIHNYLATFVISLLAFFIKETAVVTPFILLFMGFARNSDKENYRSIYFHFSISLVSIFLGLILRFYLLGYTYRQNNMAIEPGEVLPHLFLVARVITYYIRLFFLMKWNSPIHWSEIPIRTIDFISIAEIFFFLFAIISSIYISIRKKRLRWILFAFWMSLLPVLQILPIELAGNSIIAERYFSLPLFFLLLFFFQWFTQLNKKFSLEGYSAVFVLGILFYQLLVSVYLQFQWQNSKRLWEYTMRQEPRSRLAYINLANIYYEKNSFELSLKYSENAVLISKPITHRDTYETAIANFMKANSLMKLKYFEQAETEYRKTIDLAAYNHVPLEYITNFSICLLVLNKSEEARTLLNKSLTMNPNNPMVTQKVKYILEHEEEVVKEFR